MAAAAVLAAAAAMIIPAVRKNAGKTVAAHLTAPDSSTPDAAPEGEEANAV